MSLRDKSKASKKEEATTTTEEKAQEEEAGKVVVKESSSPALLSEHSVFIANPMFIEAVQNASYGTFPSVTANNGTHMAGENDLGKVLKFQAIISNNVVKVIPGSNDEEAKEFFAVSADGEFVKDGRSVQEAVQDAKDAGYEKASAKDYVDVICIITECDNPDFVNETVTLQLAPTSIYTWRQLEGRCKMQAALKKLVSSPVMGDEGLGMAVVFTSTATPTSWKGNSFTKFVFSI